MHRKIYSFEWSKEIIMSKAGKINSVHPPFAIAGGEITIECEDFNFSSGDAYDCFFNGTPARLVAASSKRVLAIVPGDLESEQVEIYLEINGEKSNSISYKIGKKIADDVHLVANPAVDPKDNSIILTRSGSRGQKMPVSLYRLENDGFLSEMKADVLNPTAVAFSRSGNMYVTNRADGEVCRVNRDEEVVPYATGLGVATGLAFDKEGIMFVGDRSGTVYKITEFGNSESFAVLEPSVSAYHFAFGPDGKLYATAPGLSSFDAIYVIDKEGFDEKFFRGFGRPQGLAFDRDGNLYVAASYQGRQGIIRIKADSNEAELFVAGTNVIGVCFTRKGEMIIGTNESVFALDLGIYGTLLD